MKSSKPKRIVVIEDDSDFLNMLKIRLTINGFDVFEARDALEGLDFVRSIVPDLVILDLRMPKFSLPAGEVSGDIDMQMGQKICRMIKFDSRLQHIPVLMLTCSDSISDIESSIKAGADAYMMKTSSMECLIMEIEKQLKIRRRSAEYEAVS